MIRHCEEAQELDECISSTIAGDPTEPLVTCCNSWVVYEGCGEVVARARSARWTGIRTRSKCVAGLNVFHDLKNASAPYWRRIASIFPKASSLSLEKRAKMHSKFLQI